MILVRCYSSVGIQEARFYLWQILDKLPFRFISNVTRKQQEKCFLYILFSFIYLAYDTKGSGGFDPASVIHLIGFFLFVPRFFIDTILLSVLLKMLSIIQLLFRN